MKYCLQCGSELKGAKKFCMVCGKEQEKLNEDKDLGIPKRSKPDAADDESGSCERCGEDTDKKCYFCTVPVCRDHYTRLQANTNSYVNMKQYITESDNKRINEGWRGLIVYSSPKCLRLKVSKQLTDEETLDINTVDECSWYKIDMQKF